MADEEIYGKEKIFKTTRRTLAFTSTDILKSFTIQGNGSIREIVFEIPDWTNASITATLTVENSDSKKIYDSGAKSENQILIIKVDVPLYGLNTVKVTLSGQPGGNGGNVYITKYIERELL